MEMPPDGEPFPFEEDEGFFDPVEERTDQLIKEFKEHYRELNAARPPGRKVKRAPVYEGWSLQKISGLQVVVEELAKRLNALEASQGD